MIDDIKHVFNRGINKNDIFIDDYDRMRFIESLYKFNNEKVAIRSETKSFFDNPPPQEKLVEILKWTLMPNHFHLLVQEKIEGGISEFVRRLGNGYTKYFNIKHKKSGFLFQNRTKMILVKSEQQFLYIPYYIDLNILDIYFPNWREDGLKDLNKALEVMKNYKWSSFPDYFDEKERDFSCVVNKELFYDLFDLDEEHYKKELKDFIKSPIKKFKPD
ncbi:MAG: transposase [Candidatus Taylorbacteria bacterium]|nr:transposase [Candidatus Taylorbacteria bacterium]